MRGPIGAISEVAPSLTGILRWRLWFLGPRVESDLSECRNRQCLSSCVWYQGNAGSDHSPTPKPAYCPLAIAAPCSSFQVCRRAQCPLVTGLADDLQKDLMYRLPEKIASRLSTFERCLVYLLVLAFRHPVSICNQPRGVRVSATEHSWQVVCRKPGTDSLQALEQVPGTITGMGTWRNRFSCLAQAAVYPVATATSAPLVVRFTAILDVK